RLLVVEGKVIGAMERQAAPGEFRANLYQAATIAAVRTSAEERSLAVRATRVLGLKVAGVDIIRSRRGPLILDVHPSPELGEIEEVSGKDIAGSMISAIEKQLGWKRRLAIP